MREEASAPWGSLNLHGNLLSGRTAIITGAGSQVGIGRAAALLFAAHGARVACVDIDAEGARKTAEQLGPEHIAIGCDLRSAEECQKAFAKSAETFGGVDILVNNAARGFRSRFMDASPNEFDDVMSINVKSIFQMCQAVVPHMRERGRGNIVCVASVAGQRGGGLFGSSHYSASKAAVIGLGKALARELAENAIRVNVVSPSLIKRFEPTPNDPPALRKEFEMRSGFEKDVPLGRSGNVWDVAGAILFAASDLSMYMTGATIDVNGGFHIR